MTYSSFIWKIVRPYRRRMAIALGVMIVVMAAGLVPPLLLATVIDDVLGDGRFELLIPLMILGLLIPCINGVFQAVGDYMMALLGERIVLDIRMALYRRVQRLSCRYLHTTTTGKIMERLRGDVQQVQMLLGSQVLSVIVQMLCALVALVIMLVLSVKLTLMVLLAIGLYVVNYKWFVRRIRSVQRRYRHKMDGLSGQAHERLAGTIVVKAFGNERKEARRFARRNFMTERVLHRFRMLNVSYGLTSSAIAWGTQLTVLLVGTLLIIRGDLTLGAMIAIGAYTGRLLAPAVQLAELSNQVEQTKISLRRIFELMQAEPDAVVLKGKRLESIRGEVAFENVCFHYEQDKPVLKHVNLYVQPGETVALIGQTGCGKSTIVNLLYRFYDLKAGHLSIDGHEISSLDTRWYRGRLALVPQDPIVFDATIAENVAYGRPTATDQQIEEALRTVELGDLIHRHESGIHAQLGERGLQLSVGERQRLCIGRAILSDPAILILDEATSSLDVHSEAMIQLALKRVMANRTCFVVAHRLSTIVNADQIVVLDQGRIVEMGNHAQLMARDDGRYRHLFMMQSAGQSAAEIA
jgi:ABC-type multidrug transport system fused ATPase/permease subunit